MRKSTIGLVLVLLCCVPAFSQQAQRNQAGRTALRQIIPGHYVFSSGTFNSGVIVTDEGVIDSEKSGAGVGVGVGVGVGAGVGVGVGVGVETGVGVGVGVGAAEANLKLAMRVRQLKEPLAE